MNKYKNYNNANFIFADTSLMSENTFLLTHIQVSSS